MRIAVVIITLMAIDCTTARAAFTDFSDYTQSQTFAAGESFSSHGLSFKAVQRLAIANPVKVVAGPSIAILQPNPGIEFLLPAGVQEVSFRYDDGAASRIAINGIEPASYPPRAGFSFLNGSMLGGVEATTSLTRDGLTIEEGTLTLRGPIGSLMIAGLELSIDDVTVLVPEPNALVLMLTSAALMTTGRRR